MTVDKQLKKKISARWQILTATQSDPREWQTALAQLTYILQESGLLAKPRKRRHDFGKISPDPIARDEKYESARYDQENNE